MRKNFNQIYKPIAPKFKMFGVANIAQEHQIGVKLKQAVALHNAGLLDQAKQIYEDVLRLDPRNFDALHLSGTIAAQTQNWDEALAHLTSALKINTKNPFLHNNLGNVYQELKFLERALGSYKKAIELDGNFPQAFYNRGKVFQELKQSNAALDSYNKAIELKRDYADAYNNRGNVLKELKRYEEALDNYDKAIEFKQNFAEAYSNRGNVLQELKQVCAALESYYQAIKINPNIEYLQGNLLHTQMQICDWQDFKNSIDSLAIRVKDGAKAIQSFQVLSLIDSLSIQLKTAQTFINNEHPFDSSLGKILKREYKQKIRLGYYSTDFREHPVSWLTTELFETHDKNKFELIAFSFGESEESEIRNRLINAFDKFIEVRYKNDKEVALLSREMGIDIAIDLTGMTREHRVGAFAYRLAPIQLSYVGYLGTMGAEYYDYLIADRTLIPIEHQQYYTEKIIYLPSYQVNDSKKLIADKIFTRAELNLPDKGFVFCCFNNNFKITPSTFDIWMRILNAVTDSVLFLYAENIWAEENLKREAEKRGVSQTRLVFGARINRSEYLARYRVADLFLDTLPYNAGTTASDALWVGLPVLTCIGESFASRMAASLLNAIGIPELIANSQEQYEAKAIEVATNPKKIKAIKDKLELNRLKNALFDTALFTKNIEAAYVKIYDNYQLELPMNHIYI